MNKQIDEILTRMSAAYAGCSTYRDKGNYSRTSPHGQISISFETLFVRPDHYRFNFRDTDQNFQSFIIWSAGQYDCKNLSPALGNKESSLDGAMMTAAAATHLASVLTGNLLVESAFGGPSRLISACNALQLERTTLNETASYRIQRTQDGMRSSLWLAVDDYRMLRYHEDVEVGAPELQNTSKQIERLLSGSGIAISADASQSLSYSEEFVYEEVGFNDSVDLDDFRS